MSTFFGRKSPKIVFIKNVISIFLLLVFRIALIVMVSCANVAQLALTGDYFEDFASYNIIFNVVLWLEKKGKIKDNGQLTPLINNQVIFVILTLLIDKISDTFFSSLKLNYTIYVGGIALCVASAAVTYKNKLKGSKPADEEEENMKEKLTKYKKITNIYSFLKEEEELRNLMKDQIEHIKVDIKLLSNPELYKEIEVNIKKRQKMERVKKNFSKMKNHFLNNKNKNIKSGRDSKSDLIQFSSRVFQSEFGKGEVKINKKSVNRKGILGKRRENFASSADNQLDSKMKFFNQGQRKRIIS